MKAKKSLNKVGARYETPMPELSSKLSKAEIKVKKHLRKMGFEL